MTMWNDYVNGNVNGNLVAKDSGYMVCFSTGAGLPVFYSIMRQEDDVYSTILHCGGFIDLKDGVLEKFSSMSEVEAVIKKAGSSIHNLKVTKGSGGISRDFFCFNEIDMLGGRVKYRRRYGDWYKQSIITGGRQTDIELVKGVGLMIYDTCIFDCSKNPIELARMSYMYRVDRFLICSMSLLQGHTGYGRRSKNWSEMRYKNLWKDASMPFTLSDTKGIMDKVTDYKYINNICEIEVNPAYGDTSVDSFPVWLVFDLSNGNMVDVVAGTSNLHGYTLKSNIVSSGFVKNFNAEFALTRRTEQMIVRV